MRRFTDIQEGPPGDLEFEVNEMTQYGTWVARWRHWSSKVKNWKTSGGCDMPWARANEEMEYQRSIVELVDGIFYKNVNVGSACDYGGWRPKKLD